MEQLIGNCVGVNRAIVLIKNTKSGEQLSIYRKTLLHLEDSSRGIIVKILHVLLGGANNKHPLSYGGHKRKRSRKQFRERLTIISWYF